MWRFGCFFILAITFTAIGASAFVSWLVARFGALPVGAVVAVFLLALAFAGARAMRRLTRPMDELIDAARRIEQGDYSARVPEAGPRDMRSVARAFSAMSERLRSSDEQRRTFLGDVVHELRTPLAVIRGQAEAIADGVYPADVEHLATIVDATHSLEVLVEDLRALALTDTGSLVLNREPVDAAALMQDVMASFEAQAEAAGVTLTSAVDPAVPTLDVDPVRMRGAIGNIVGNAINHTLAGGSVRLAVAAKGNALEVAVVDTGQGIAPELLPRVFDRFVKGTGSKGSGLGLAIAHDIVAAHGGTIEVESKVGEGTTVRISIPVA